MTAAQRGPGLIDHAIGACCSLLVLNWSSEIASAVSWPLSRMLEGGSPGMHIYFVGGVSGPSWTVAVLMLAMGLLVAGFARLVLRRRLGVWAPPVAVLCIAALEPVLAFRAGGADAGEAAVLGTTLGVLLTLAWTAYWLVALTSARLRRGASSTRLEVKRAG